VTPRQPDRRFRRLAEIARALAYAQAADQVTEVALREADALLGSHSAALLIAGGDGAVEVRASPALRLRAQRELRFTALDEDAIHHLREILVTEGEPTFLAVPMVIGGRVGGVLAMALPGGRDGDEDEWFLSAIADQAALSLEKLQLTRETEAANRARMRHEEQFQGLYDSPLIGLVFRRRDGRIADANPSFLTLAGRAREELASLTWDDLAVRGRRAAQEGLYEYDLVRADGQHLEVLVGTAPLADQECDLAFVIDISRRKRAEMSMRILSELSKALLGASLDYEALWTSLAWLVVPRFADWCAVEAVEEGAGIGRNVALEHVSVSEAEGALEWRRRFPPDPKSRVGVAEVIRTARSQLHAHIGESFLAEYTCAAESELKRRGLRSALLVPMVLHGAVVGVITCVRTAARRRFDKDDQVLAEEMARRAASAVENARPIIARRRPSACATSSSPSPPTS
jgi:PAS domain S-box-containing protein